MYCVSSCRLCYCHVIVWQAGERKSRVFQVESVHRALPRLNENDHLCAVGMIQAGILHCAVATQYGVYINTVQALWRRFQQFSVHINTIQALWRRFQQYGVHLNTIQALWRRFQQFGVHINTIQSLWIFQQFGIVRDRRPAGHLRMTSQQQDNHI